jgi:hypothetical protein
MDIIINIALVLVYSTLMIFIGIILANNTCRYIHKKNIKLNGSTIIGYCNKCNYPILNTDQRKHMVKDKLYCTYHYEEKINHLNNEI